MYARDTKHSPVIGPGLVPAPASLPYDDQRDAGRSRPSAQLPLSGAPAFATDPSCLAGSRTDPRKHTQTPYVTGNSVVAFTYADGVVIACDTLGSYGSTKRYKAVQRIFQVNKNCVVGASGEISDFQQIQKYLDELAEDDFIAEDGIQWTPKELHSYLTRVMYNRRDKFDPLWNSLIVAGIEPDGKPFVGMVSMIGVQYTDTCVCTGFAAHLALPLLRKYQAADMDEANAKALMEDALRVCFYRDKDSINRFIMVTVTKEGITFGEPMAVPTNWNFKIMQNPTKFSPGSW